MSRGAKVVVRADERNIPSPHFSVFLRFLSLDPLSFFPSLRSSCILRFVDAGFLMLITDGSAPVLLATFACATAHSSLSPPIAYLHRHVHQHSPLIFRAGQPTHCFKSSESMTSRCCSFS